MRKLSFLSAVAIGLFALGSLDAQSPAPIVVQAATPAPAAPAVSNPGPATAAADTKNMMQLLQQMQATNAETIKRQEAALQTLDQLQKAAEEIKIFSKRG